MKPFVLPLAAIILLGGCSNHGATSHRGVQAHRGHLGGSGAGLSLRAAEQGRDRRLTNAQIRGRERAAAQANHVILGSWSASNFIPFAHQGGFGAELKARKDGETMTPLFNRKHIAGREELSMSSLEKTLEGGAVLDIDITALAGHSGKHLVLHHDAAIGRTTGRRPGKRGKPLPEIAELTLSELPDYGIHLKGGGFADILTFGEFIERFPNEAFSVETKTRTAAVNLVKFVNDLPRSKRRKFLNRALIAAIARPGDESALGPDLATAEPTKILRDGLGDAAVIASSEAETIAFVTAYGVPGLSWVMRRFQPGPPPTLTGDFLGAPATAFGEMPTFRRIPFVRNIPTTSTKLMKEAHKQGVMVLPWTIDDRGALNRAVRIGADGVFSNDPRILDDLIREMGDTVRTVISRTE